MIFNIFFFFLLTVLFYFFNKILLEKKIFIDSTEQLKHKSFFGKNEKQPFTGGLFLLITLIILYYDSEYVFLITALALIFFTGIISDIKFINSPLIRFLAQLIIVVMFVLISELFVENTRMTFLDLLLNNIFFKIFFTIFCFLVLINGSNFIDGANTLLIGYFLIVSFIIFNTVKLNNLHFDLELVTNLIFILFILFIFNFFSKTLMGDSGSYMLGIIFGYFCIILVNENPKVSPIFALNLLWYPAFENLFSIIRKYKNKVSPTNPDNLHLHHLIYLKLKKEKLRIKNKFLNSYSGMIINSFNFISIYLASVFYFHSFKLGIILLINVFIYLFAYRLLK